MTMILRTLTTSVLVCLLGISPALAAPALGLSEDISLPENTPKYSVLFDQQERESTIAQLVPTLPGVVLTPSTVWFKENGVAVRPWDALGNHSNWKFTTSASTRTDQSVVLGTDEGVLLSPTVWKNELLTMIDSMGDPKAVAIDIRIPMEGLSATQWTVGSDVVKEYAKGIRNMILSIHMEQPAVEIIVIVDALTADTILPEGISGVLLTPALQGENGTALATVPWITQLEILATLQKEGIHSYMVMDLANLDRDERMFYRASLGLLDESKVTAILTAGDTPGYWPEWSMHLGQPTETKEMISHYKDINTGVYARSYEHGMVIVNPSDVTVTFPIEGLAEKAYISGGGALGTTATVQWVNVADQVTVGPAQGVFLRTSNVNDSSAIQENSDAVAKNTEENSAVTVTTTTSADESLVVGIEGMGAVEEETTSTVSDTTATATATSVELVTGSGATALEVTADVKVDFLDVPASLRHSQAIWYLRDRGVIQGYEDGSYRPYQTVNRAELLKILLEGMGVEVTAPAESCFPDVPKDAWFAPYVCTAYANGWVQGYPTGYFRPERTVNKVEAVKILGEVQGWPIEASAGSGLLFSDIDGNAWYAPYLRYAKAHGFLEEDGTVYGPTFGMNRGKIAEYMFRTMIIKDKGVDVFSDSLR